MQLHPATVRPRCMLGAQPGKFLYIRFGLALKMRLEYKISSIVLSSVNSINDLGILFESKLIFLSHCHYYIGPKHGTVS